MEMVNKTCSGWFYSVLIGGLLLAPALYAAPIEGPAKFHGTLRVVECSINANNGRQLVNFGDAVGIHKIDGKRYQQPVPFTVSCTNYAGADVPDLTLKIEGKAVAFDEAAVETDVNGLGIQLQSNGKPQKLNQAVRFGYKAVPVLTAVPVKDPATELDARPFSATVKLTVEVA